MVDWTLQNHHLNTTMDGDMAIITGHSWGIDSPVERVEFRIDGGQWFQTTYEGVPSDLSALVPFNWTLALDTTSLSSGTHIVEIRASDSDGISLPVVLEIDGGGSAEGAAGLSAYLFSLGIVLIVVLVSSVVLFLRTGDEDDTDLSSDILEATLVASDDIELDSMTVAELKEMLRSEGLSISGNKDDLIQRLRDVPKSR